MQPLSSNKLGRYEIVDELGKGAMGVVYLARDPLIGRLVALKTFRIGYSVRDAELEQFRARFIREAQSAGILSHPNIVTIHDVVERGDEGVAFIAMEYVRGTNLKSVLQEPQRPTLPYVVEVLTQIADGLDYAHSCKVIHRDVKPANILITADNRAKITDFGIARLDTSNLTQEGQLLGTPNYMSPEQILGRDVDHRADIFSLGVVLYEMITRHKPFQGENLTMVSHRIVYDQFTPVKDYVDDLPPGTEQILAKALEKDPNRRYQRARDMADDLRRVVGSVGRRDLLNETQSLSSTTALPPGAFVLPQAGRGGGVGGGAGLSGSAAGVAGTAGMAGMAGMADTAGLPGGAGASGAMPAAPGSGLPPASAWPTAGAAAGVAASGAAAPGTVASGAVASAAAAGAVPIGGAAANAAPAAPAAPPAGARLFFWKRGAGRGKQGKAAAGQGAPGAAPAPAGAEPAAAAHDPGTGSGTGAGSGTGTGSGIGTGAGTGNATGTGSGTGAGAGDATGTGSGTGAGTGSGAGPGVVVPIGAPYPTGAPLPAGAPYPAGASYPAAPRQEDAPYSPGAPQAPGAPYQAGASYDPGAAPGATSQMRLAELPTAPLPGRAIAAAAAAGAAAAAVSAPAPVRPQGAPPLAGGGAAVGAGAGAPQPEYRHGTRPVEQPPDLAVAASQGGASQRWAGGALPPEAGTPATAAGGTPATGYPAAPAGAAVPQAAVSAGTAAVPAGAAAPIAAPVARPRRGFFSLPSAVGLAVALVVGLVLALLLASSWLLWSRSASVPDSAAARDRARQAARVQTLTLLHEAKRRLDAGDAAGAELLLRSLEAMAPGVRAARTLRSEVDRQQGDQARRVDQERLIEDKLNEARLALGDRRFDDAEAAATAVMTASPGNTVASDLLAQVKQGRLRAKDRQAAAARQQALPAPPPVVVAAAPVAPRPAAAPAPAVESKDSTLELAFFSEQPQGSLMIYVNDSKMVQESFRFYEKGGLFRSKPTSGWVRRSVHVTAGSAHIRVYVTPQGSAAVVRTLSGNFPGGGSRHLDVKLDASGQVTAELQ